MNIQEVLYECQRGNFYTAYENQKMINDRALEILNSDDMIVKQNMLQDLVDIIKIGNYTYNNTDADVLPIDDGIYDLLVVKLMNINPDLFTPGALPVISVNLNASAPYLSITSNGSIPFPRDLLILRP